VGKLFDWLYLKGKVPPVPKVIGARLPERTILPPIHAEFVNRNMVDEFHLSQKFERTFAASGLEHCSPFCDLALARAAFTITDKLKIRFHVSKYVLRRALATIVDDEFRQLPKFPQRMRYDVAFAETLDEVAREALSDASVQRRNLFEPHSIRRLFRSRRERPYSAEAAMRLWTAVLTEIWAQLFLDQRGAATAAPSDPSNAAERPLVPFERTLVRAH
jgi:asparagine synthetase B (glutamine-hydrolysing)